MPMPSKDTSEKVEQGILQYAYAWGANPLPPTLAATLITAQHIRPFQPLAMLFPPVLLLASYLNLSDYKKDAAGVTSAWSGAYMLLAWRRKQNLSKRFGARGLIRGATLGLCGINFVAGGLAYAFGKRKEEEKV